jgi:hypothetical protein
VVAELAPRERLLLIAKALRHCGEVVDRESLRVQFRRESRAELTAADLDLVLRHVAREAERASSEGSGEARPADVPGRRRQIRVAAETRAERLRKAVAARTRF